MPNYLNTPLIPAAPVKAAQAAIDTPNLNRSPWEARIRGFGAGALEGLRNLSTPTNLASTALLAVPGVGEASALGRVASEAPEAIQGLSKAIPAAETLGESLPEFTAVGGEGLYNVAKGAVKGVMDPVEAAYARILSRGGR